VVTFISDDIGSIPILPFIKKNGVFFMESFSERLIYLRHSHNLTPKEVREAMELSPATYSRYEKGLRVPNNEMILNFAMFYEVSPMYMLGFSHLQNGEDFLLDVLEEIESEDTPEGLKAKYALREYRKKFAE
jgi:transcriptional regulator with XRE-family HTH domain